MTTETETWMVPVPVTCEQGHRWTATRRTRFDKLRPLACPTCGAAWRAEGDAMTTETEARAALLSGDAEPAGGTEGR